MAVAKMSATQAKVQFGTLLQVKAGKPVMIEKNKQPAVVVMSVDDYEDWVEIKDASFQKRLEKDYREIKSGKAGNLENLYKIHRQTILKEAKGL